MNITLKHIRSFIAISETGSFVEAAELMHCSQPAISITIKNLEAEIGGKLFHRTTRSLILTPEGYDFLPIAKRLIVDFSYAIDDLRNHLSLQRGKLSIAAIPSFSITHLPRMLSNYRQKFPKVDISVEDVITEDVVKFVETGRVELGVTFDPGNISGLEFHPFYEDQFVALLPEGHPLILNKEINIGDLLKHDLIMLQRPSSVREYIEKSVDKLGFNLKSSLETHQLATIGRMVATGLGVSIVPSISQQHMEELGAVCRPLEAPHIIRSIGVLTKTRSPLSIASKEMIKIIIEG